MINRKHSGYLLLALVVVALSGCAASTPAATLTSVPTIAVPTATTAPTATSAPTSTPEPTEIAYPYPVEEEVPLNPYPVDEGAAPGGSPVRDNRSRVTAQFIEKAPDPDNAGFVRLRVQVTAVEEIAGIANLAAALVNTETDLFANSGYTPELKPGDVFSAEISYRGDESGGKFYVVLFDQ